LGDYSKQQMGEVQHQYSTQHEQCNTK